MPLITSITYPHFVINRISTAFNLAIHSLNPLSKIARSPLFAISRLRLNHFCVLIYPFLSSKYRNAKRTGELRGISEQNLSTLRYELVRICY
ncbi:hypothetical protein BpHYR1_042922 [Brachionus plicatilis]|uniref:Uncharacterized protein n=1 Tax=Brachionus plicatilis TaxID=10195 RepID=A0A3M7QDW5_BRAPC|nr:hypothetical protein BpHYR1_042922 [Brachionus plicatilis]